MDIYNILLDIGHILAIPPPGRSFSSLFLPLSPPSPQHRGNEPTIVLSPEWLAEAFLLLSLKKDKERRGEQRKRGGN